TSRTAYVSDQNERSRFAAAQKLVSKRRFGAAPRCDSRRYARRSPLAGSRLGPHVVHVMATHTIDDLKRVAAETAARRVESGMAVGLGTGSTAIHAVSYLGNRLRTGELKDIRAVPTSYQSMLLAREVGILVVSLDEVERLDVAIDGADE